MARINIEESWWTDPRRSILITTLGSEMAADWAALRAWRLAQDYWKEHKQLVPKQLFERLFGAEALIECGLADVRDSFVYVRGSSKAFEWIHEKKLQATEAGRKSAEARRVKHGSAQPKRRTTPERPSNDLRTESNDSEPSYSSSSSSSYEEEEKNIYIGEFQKSESQASKGVEVVKSDIELIKAQWFETLAKYNLKQSWSELDERFLFMLLRQPALNPTTICDAILGMQCEKRTRDYDPAAHISLGRFFDRMNKLKLNIFDKLQKLGAKERELREAADYSRLNTDAIING